VTKDNLSHIVTESRKGAIQNLKNRSPEILELISWTREWMEEDKKAAKG
jgi:hypothetical protein